MKRLKNKHPRQDARITAQRDEEGGVLIGVARGWTGAGEILYRLDRERLEAAAKDQREAAVIINNLGLLVLGQLTGFNLADSLEGLGKAVALWGGVEVKGTKVDDPEEALRIARKTLHGDHGRQSTTGDGPVDSDCGCRGTTDQMVCAAAGCGFCLAAEDMAAELGKERHEG